MKLKLIIGAFCVVNALSGMSREITTECSSMSSYLTISLLDESKSWHVPRSVVKHIPLVQSLNISEKESYLPRAISAEQMEDLIPILKSYAIGKKFQPSTHKGLQLLLSRRSYSQLCQIAHAADALGLNEVLEASCKHIADRITDSQEIKACVRRGRYEFPIDSADTQLAIPVQHIIATHMQHEGFTSRLMEACSKKLQGHTHTVTSAVFNRAGNKIVTASHDGTARVWNAQTGALEHILRRHLRWISSATFNRAGDKVVTVSDYGISRIWNARTGALEHTLRLPRDPVISRVLTRVGGKIVTASTEGMTRIWDAQTGALEHTLHGHTRGVLSAALTRVGGKIVTASVDGTARLWNAQTGVLERILQGHTHIVTSAAFNSAGDTVVTASGDCTARMWNARTGALEHILRGHETMVTSAMFNRAGDKIVTASLKGITRLWNAQTGMLERSLRGHTGVVTSAVFNSAGDKMLTASCDGTARIWYLTMPHLLPEQVALLHILLENGELPEITPAMREIAAQVPILLREKLLAAYPFLRKNSRTQQLK